MLLQELGNLSKGIVERRSGRRARTGGRSDSSNNLEKIDLELSSSNKLGGGGGLVKSK